MGFWSGLGIWLSGIGGGRGGGHGILERPGDLAVGWQEEEEKEKEEKEEKEEEEGEEERRRKEEEVLTP